MEVLHRQARDRQEQVWFELGDDVLECVLAEVGQVHERGNACGEFDQLLLDEFALGLVLLLLVGQLPLLLRRQVPVLGLLLEVLDLVALVDDRLNDVVAQRAPALDVLHGGHRFGIVQDAAQSVVVHVHQ